jgi:hypothetical protein
MNSFSTVQTTYQSYWLLTVPRQSISKHLLTLDVEAVAVPSALSLPSASSPGTQTNFTVAYPL